VNFQVPDSCTGVVGFALFTDQERLRRLQADAREKAQSVSSIAKTIPNPYAAAAGIALDLVSGVTNSGDGAFTYYIVDQVGRAQYDAEQPFYFIDKGENTSDALFKVTLEPGKLYYLKLVNASILDKSVVAYQVAATTKKPRYVKHSEEVPEVRRRKIKTGTRRVPRVEERVAPHLPWKADK
jgi:hypothetical protein